MDDFDSGFFLLRALAGPAMAIVSLLVTITIFVPIVMYVIARWRAHRDPEVDRHLGIKVALHYFATTALHLGLAGLALLVWALISRAPSEAKSAVYRIAVGMILPAGLVMGAHLSLLRRTNDQQVTSVRRLFAGYNLIFIGVIGFIALVLAFQALTVKGSSGEMGRVAGAMVVVYGTAWAWLGWRFGQAVLGGGGGGAIATPPVEQPPAATPPAAPGLPALGGGAFPPIDPPKA